MSHTGKQVKTRKHVPHQIWASSSALRTLLSALSPEKDVRPCGILLGYKVPLGYEIVSAVETFNSDQMPQSRVAYTPTDIVKAIKSTPGPKLDLVGFWTGNLQGSAQVVDIDYDLMQYWADFARECVWAVVGRNSCGTKMIRFFDPYTKGPKKVNVNLMTKSRGKPSQGVKE